MITRLGRARKRLRTYVLNSDKKEFCFLELAGASGSSRIATGALAIQEMCDDGLLEEVWCVRFGPEIIGEYPSLFAMPRVVEWQGTKVEVTPEMLETVYRR